MDWLTALEQTPVQYVGENTGRMATREGPLLEVAYQASGVETEVVAGGEVVTSRPGTLMVLNGHFGNHATPDGRWSYLCLSLIVGAADEMAGVGDRPFVWSAEIGEAPALVRRYRRLELMRTSDVTLKSVRMKMAVMGILLEAHDQLLGNGPSGRLRPRAVEEAMLFMGRHYKRHDLTLADIARAAGLSVAHFGRLFRREMGAPPMKHLTQVRIDRARELLNRSDLQVGEVGFAVGFADRLHFSRVFRQYVGVSPQGFREGGWEISPPAD